MEGKRDKSQKVYEPGSYTLETLSPPSSEALVLLSEIKSGAETLRKAENLGFFEEKSTDFISGDMDFEDDVQHPPKF